VAAIGTVAVERCPEGTSEFWAPAASGRQRARIYRPYWLAGQRWPLPVKEPTRVATVRCLEPMRNSWLYWSARGNGLLGRRKERGEWEGVR